VEREVTNYSGIHTHVSGEKSYTEIPYEAKLQFTRGEAFSSTPDRGPNPPKRDTLSKLYRGSRRQLRGWNRKMG